MTDSQRKEWQQRMTEREIRMLNYYRAPLSSKADIPDGSFMMGAFLQGWDAAVKSMKKSGKGSEKGAGG